MSILEIVRQSIIAFCLEYVRHPYLTYTEHGLHALFYCRLYNALPEEARYVVVQNQKVCVLQKEYPTAGNLGKSKRQHWDIAVLANPPEDALAPAISYDYMKILAAIEFGMNEQQAHLVDDIERLSHADANVKHGFIVHLYRLSEAGARLSGRDWSPKSREILQPGEVVTLSVGRSVEIFYGMADVTGAFPKRVWMIKNGTKLDVSEADVSLESSKLANGDNDDTPSLNLPQ